MLAEILEASPPDLFEMIGRLLRIFMRPCNSVAEGEPIGRAIKVHFCKSGPLAYVFKVMHNDLYIGNPQELMERLQNRCMSTDPASTLEALASVLEEILVYSSTYGGTVRMIAVSNIAEALLSCTYVYDHCQHSIIVQDAMLIPKAWETPHGMEVQIMLRAFPSFQLDLGKKPFLAFIRKLAIFGVGIGIELECSDGIWGNFSFELQSRQSTLSLPMNMISEAEMQIRLLYEEIFRGLALYLERGWIPSKNLAVSVAGNEGFRVELAMLIDDCKSGYLGGVHSEAGHDETPLVVFTFHDGFPSFHPWKEGKDGLCIMDGIMNSPWVEYGYSINKKQCTDELSVSLSLKSAEEVYSSQSEVKALRSVLILVNIKIESAAYKDTRHAPREAAIYELVGQGLEGCFKTFGANTRYFKPLGTSADRKNLIGNATRVAHAVADIIAFSQNIDFQKQALSILELDSTYVQKHKLVKVIQDLLMDKYARRNLRGAREAVTIPEHEG